MTTTRSANKSDVSSRKGLVQDKQMAYLGPKELIQIRKCNDVRWATAARIKAVAVGAKGGEGLCIGA